MDLAEKIRKKEAKVAIIGLGYVGLPLAIEFARAGFVILGLDTDKKKIAQLERLLKTGSVNSASRHLVKEFPFLLKDIHLLSKAFQQKRWLMSPDVKLCRQADCLIICVPTPLEKHRQPDLSYIEKAGTGVAENLQPGVLVVLESTTYPGTTEEVLRKCLEQGGRRCGKDIYLAFSPERIDPGNTYPIKKIPKIVGGVDRQSGRLAKLLYQQVFETVTLASQAKTAEMAKLLENIFRNVNIALVNELAILCRRMGISIWEVVELASSKPYGFMPFYPGPGLGGHCIPIDPFYLTWKAHEYDFSTKFIELAGEINTNMPYYVVSLIQDALASQKKSLQGAKIFILGVTYKKDIADTRESPALKIIEILQTKQAQISYHDPFVPRLKLAGLNMNSRPLISMKQADCVVLVTNHSEYDIKEIVRYSHLLVDTRGATHKARISRNNIFCL